MRIHTNNLTSYDIRNALRYPDVPGVFATVVEHGSRSHARAFEVSLSGNGYRKNTGTSGAGDEFGATWDEWGVFLSRLFGEDPNALCGSVKYPTYRNGYDFHVKTAHRFADLVLPDDTHKRHNFRGGNTPGRTQCTKCSAQSIWSY